MKNFEITIWRTDNDNNPYTDKVKAVTADEAKKYATEKYYENEKGSIYDILVAEV